VAGGHTPHLDALFIRAARKAADYILELAVGRTMDIFEHYAMLHRGLPQRRPQRPGTGVLVNTMDIVLFQTAPKPTYVSAEGRSAMDMETPGPSQNKWMKALSVQMRFSVILCIFKQRNASANGQLMILWTVRIVVKDWKSCLHKHAKLLRTPWASPTTRNR